MVHIYVTDAIKAQCLYGGMYDVLVVYFPHMQDGSSLTLNVTCRSVDVGTKARKEVTNWTFCSACYIFLHGEVHVPTARKPDRKLSLIPISCSVGVVLDEVSKRVMVSISNDTLAVVQSFHTFFNIIHIPQDFHERVRTHVLPTWLRVVNEYYDALVSIIVYTPTRYAYIRSCHANPNDACRTTRNSLNPSVNPTEVKQKWKRTLC